MEEEGKIYVGQTKLRLTVECLADLTGATAQVIKYIKPDESTGSFTAILPEAAKGDIYYDFQTDDLDMSGDWTFWSYITFADGSVPGEAFTIHVYNEGE